MGGDAGRNRPTGRFRGGGRINRKYHRPNVSLVRQLMRDCLDDNRRTDLADDDWRLFGGGDCTPRRYGNALRA